MKILIINPNSDKEFTELIKIAASKGASQGTKIICKNAPGAPRFIENYVDEIKCGPGMLQLLNEYEDKVDAFIIACTCDVNIDVMREQTNKPVIGIGESSMMAAMMLGEKFSVVQMTSRSVSTKKRMVTRLGYQSRCASVRGIDENDPRELTDKIIDAARIAVEEDGAEVITMGCAGLSGINEKVEAKLGVPAIDGIPFAVKFAEAHVVYGACTSKQGVYGPNPT